MGLRFKGSGRTQFAHGTSIEPLEGRRLFTVYVYPTFGAAWGNVTLVPVVLNGSNVGYDLTKNGNVQTRYGLPGYSYGDYQNTTGLVINCGAGDDTIDGSAATIPLTLSGNDGDDSILGGSGNDSLDGASGNDTISGYGGGDSITGGTGTDYLDGSSGNDTIYGGDLADTVLGSSGNDLLFGDQDIDSLSGGSGFDTLDGGAGNDLMQGGTEADSMLGGTGDDYMEGGAGNDTLKGQAGSDSMYGNENDDLFDAVDSFADAKIIGGPDNDTAYVDNPEDLTAATTIDSISQLIQV